MSTLASVLPASGPAFPLVREVPRMTEASSVTALPVRAGAALPLARVRLISNDPNR